VEKSGRSHGTEMPEAALGVEVAHCLEKVTLRLSSNSRVRVCQKVRWECLWAGEQLRVVKIKER
jgi:hypothetical protein